MQVEKLNERSYTGSFKTKVILVALNHGRTGRKKLGRRKEICPTFSDCARVVKKNFPEKLSKIVVDGGGRSD
jgi:hypothetical protein